MLTLQKLLNNTRGSVGFIALLSTFACLVIGGAYWTLSSSSLSAAAGSQNDISAQYAAEAGIQKAIAKLNDDPNYTPSGSDASFTINGGTCTISITNDGSTKTITSTANVGGIARTITVTGTMVSSTSGSTDTGNAAIFSNYAVFANKSIGFNSGTPQIYQEYKTSSAVLGNAGTNTSVSIGGISNTTVNNMYTPDAASHNSTSWGYKVANKWVYANPAGTLTVAFPDLPTDMPTASTPISSITNLASFQKIYPTAFDLSNWASGNQIWNATQSLTNSAYYYNGSLTLASAQLIAPAGQAVTIWINGDLNLTTGGKKSSITYSDIQCDNLTLYVTGNVNLNQSSYLTTTSSSKLSSGQIKIYAGSFSTTNSSYLASGSIDVKTNGTLTTDSYAYIQAAETGSLNLYSNAGINITNYSRLSGGTTFIQAKGAVSLNSSATINKSYSSAITRIYSYAAPTTTNGVYIGGKAGMFVTQANYDFNSSFTAESMIFLSNNASQTNAFSGEISIAGIYTNGAIAFNSGTPRILRSSSIFSDLGLTGSTTKVFQVFSLTTKNST